MEPITVTAAWLLAMLLIPVVFLLWLTESQEQRIRRFSRKGMSQRQLAAHFNVTRWQVRVALAGGAA